MESADKSAKRKIKRQVFNFFFIITIFYRNTIALFFLVI